MRKGPWASLLAPALLLGLKSFRINIESHPSLIYKVLVIVLSNAFTH